MAHPPYSRMQKEARIWFNKSLDECTDDEYIFCEDMAFDYCGMSRTEAAEEEYREKHGYDDDCYEDDEEDEEESEEE